LEEENRANCLINLKSKGRGFSLSSASPSGALAKEGALCSELTALYPDLSLTERRCTHAKIIFFRNSGSGPDAPSSVTVIDL